MKNITKKDYWFCERCEKIIKDRFPFIVKGKKYCAIPDKDSCPVYLKSNYD